MFTRRTGFGRRCAQPPLSGLRAFWGFEGHMAKTTLTISSRNYSSWSLRGWLLAKFAGLEFEVMVVPPDDADARKELLLLSPSILVPRLTHDGIKVWDTLAIAEYLNEVCPHSLLPEERAARAHCRA